MWLQRIRRGTNQTNAIYLGVTYRRGQPFAAYLYLPCRAGDKRFRTSLAAPGLVVDYTRAGKPIRIEITAPGNLILAAINPVLRDLGFPRLTRADIAPLQAA